MRSKITIGLCSAILLYFSVPTIQDWIGDQSDPYQNKCTAHRPDLKPNTSRRDPYRTPRPMEIVHRIHLTNAGEFVDRCELTDVLADLAWDNERFELKKWFPQGSKSGLPKLVVLFIHGWNHNGDDSDTDYISFTKLVEQLRDASRGKKNVVGTYVAWNGASNLGPFFPLSFWSKKAVADRIAQSSSVTKIVSAIGAMIERQRDVPDQFVAIGHSFGARLLFAATAQALIYQSEKAHPGKPGSPYATLSGSADLAIFLNPAFEASMYTALADLTRTEETFQKTQLPISVIISTENDEATKVMFPIGQWIGSSRGERETTTIGNYQKYQTHKMVKSEESNCSALGGAGISEVYFASNFCLKRVLNEWYPNDPVRPQIQEHNPFMVVSATADVINGHNGIWANQFASWLFEFVTSMVSRRDQGEKTPPVAG